MISNGATSGSDSAEFPEVLSVSVALCTRNGERFIKRQLSSILEQTLVPFELVISDDGSSDDTMRLIHSMTTDFVARGISLIVIANPKPLGVTRNFEAAISSTTGDIIVLSDQDDVWNDDRVATIAEAFDSNPLLDFVFSNALLINAEGEPLKLTLFQSLEITEATLRTVHDGGCFGVLLRRNIATGATTAIRRKVLRAALPFDRAWVHDEWLAMITASTGVVDVIERPLIHYRQHNDNVIGVARPTLRHKLSKLFEARGERSRSLLARSVSLTARLEKLGDLVPAKYLAEARAKSEFERMRSSYPVSRLKRVAFIARAARSGAYSKYSSQGRLDMVRDLLQSAG